MLVHPIKTRIITEEDNILDVLLGSLAASGLEVQDNDILTIAETPLGTTEGRVVKLSEVKVTMEANELAVKFELLPEIAQLVIQEADDILGGIPHVVLTIKNNTLMANAGIDKSNVPPGYASLLPLDPRASARRIRTEIKERTGKTVGVMIIADNLASACTAVMGESNESVPAALMRDAPVEFVDESFDSSEMWISPSECMYMAIFNQWRKSSTS
jgi:coenzyme F420-0:L-glutamate ligase/coenzyme F420-1:gamma-L-glutamate ligase